MVEVLGWLTFCTASEHLVFLTAPHWLFSVHDYENGRMSLKQYKIMGICPIAECLKQNFHLYHMWYYWLHKYASVSTWIKTYGEIQRQLHLTDSKHNTTAERPGLFNQLIKRYKHFRTFPKAHIAQLVRVLKYC